MCCLVKHNLYFSDTDTNSDPGHVTDSGQSDTESSEKLFIAESPEILNNNDEHGGTKSSQLSMAADSMDINLYCGMDLTKHHGSDLKKDTGRSNILRSVLKTDDSIAEGSKEVKSE